MREKEPSKEKTREIKKLKKRKWEKKKLERRKWEKTKLKKRKWEKKKLERKKWEEKKLEKRNRKTENDIEKHSKQENDLENSSPLFLVVKSTQRFQSILAVNNKISIEETRILDDKKFVEIFDEFLIEYLTHHMATRDIVLPVAKIG